MRSLVGVLACVVVLAACAGPPEEEGEPLATAGSTTAGASTAPPAVGTPEEGAQEEGRQAADGRATFPVSLDPTGRHLVDADGDRFLIQGDAAWSMIVQLDEAGTASYLSTRRAQGFNTLVVSLIEHQFADDPPRDEAGRAPFEVPGDFSTPNDAYFDAAEAQLRQAADEGFLVLLTPAYLGFDGGEEGWYADMEQAGEETLRAYGRYLGERFADVDNIVWVHAGDFSPPPEGLPLVEAVAEGLAEAGATQLRTAHGRPEDSASDLGLDIALDLDTTYTYGPTWIASREDHTDAADIPHFLFEAAYEEERELSRQQLRAQAWGALFSGAIGQVYGHSAVWQFLTTWPDALTSPGAQDQQHIDTLMATLPWPDLEPDLDASLVVEGSGNYEQDDFAVAAATSGRDVAVVYLPRIRTIGLELGRDASAATVSWFDPVDGSTVAAEVEVDGTVLRATPPGDNAGDDRDWVLVVRFDGGGDPPPATAAVRLEGADRIATAVEVSRWGLDRADVAVLGSAEDFPDALVSAPLAVDVGATMLLTTRDRLPAATGAELDRLGVRRVLLVGGTAVIGPAVEEDLQARGIQVERISGPDRVATSVEVARAIDQAPDLVVLAGGAAFPDALSGGALAARLGVPLLLTDRTDLDADVAALVGDAQVLVVGGTAVVGDTVVEALGDRGAAVTRLAGSGRYDTAALVLAELIGRRGAPASMWMATGADFPDGLVAAPGAVRDQGMVLLTDGRSAAVPEPVAEALAGSGLCAGDLRLVGGQAVLSSDHEAALAHVLAC